MNPLLLNFELMHEIFEVVKTSEVLVSSDFTRALARSWLQKAAATCPASSFSFRV